MLVRIEPLASFIATPLVSGFIGATTILTRGDPAELDKWRANCTAALAEPEEARASPQATRQDKKRIKELERDLLRKDRALAETAALLALSKKVEAIFNRNKGEDE